VNTLPSEVAKIGPYRIAEQIGEGGMGVVYLATAPDGSRVSVKTLRPWLVGGTDGRRRFEREVATLRRVRGRRIAEVIDADITADPPYVVTRYVDGVPLTRLVGESGPLRGPALLDLARGLLEALRSVHAAGVVHRDVKPANVLMSDDGPVLIDFGIAHAADDTRLTATGFISGTPGYLAPETVLGRDPTAATDLHGWAATMVFAATGRPPYGHGPDIAVFDRVRRGEHDLTGVEPGLAGVLSSALRVDPATRPGTEAVLTAIDALARPDAAETLAMPPAPPAAVPAERAADLEATDETAALRVPPPERPRPVAQPPPQPPPPRPAATGGGLALGGHAASVVLALGGVVLVLLLGWAPVVGAAATVVTLLAGRTGWRIERRLYERRKVRGTRRNDRWLAVLAAPWDVLGAVLPALGQAIFALACGLATGSLVALWDGSGLRGPYLAGAVVTTALVWWGPGGVRSRRGLKIAVEPLNRMPRAVWAPVTVLVLGVCLLVLSWESYGDVWWPTAGPPEFLPLPTW